MPWTKEERNEYARRWYSANRERLREYHRDWERNKRRLRPEEVRGYERRQYALNPARRQYRLAYKRLWLADHPSYNREWWRQNHYRLSSYNSVSSQYQARWRKENPLRTRDAEARYRDDHQEKIRLKQQTRRARIKSGFVETDITVEALSQLNKKQKGRCVYCHQEKKLTLDHVIPLSKGGRHMMSNVVLACLSCNSSKGARLAY